MRTAALLVLVDAIANLKIGYLILSAIEDLKIILSIGMNFNYKSEHTKGPSKISSGRNLKNSILFFSLCSLILSVMLVLSL